MRKCPNCGHDLPRTGNRRMEAVVDEFLSHVGGEESVASALAEWFATAKDNPARQGTMLTRVMEMIQHEDKARMHQNFADDVAEAHERGYVIEYALGDIEVLNTINRMAIERGMLPSLNVIEAEYARIG